MSSLLEHDVRKKNRISQNTASLTKKLCQLRFLFIDALLNEQPVGGTHGTAIKLLHKVVMVALDSLITGL